MRLKALDTLHISALGPGNLSAGDIFEMSIHDGQILIKRGLAIEVDEAASDGGTPSFEPDELPATKTEAASSTAPEDLIGTKPQEQPPISNKAGANTRTKAA